VGHSVDPEGSNVLAIVEYVVNGVGCRVETNVYVSPESVPIGAPRRVAYFPDVPRRAQVAGANRYATPLALSIATLVVGALSGGLTYLLLRG
jgi:hypothetical protein